MDVDTAQAAAQVPIAAPAAPEVDLSPGGVGIPPEVLNRLPPPPVADPVDDTSVNIGSNSWHSQVPSVSSIVYLWLIDFRVTFTLNIDYFVLLFIFVTYGSS